MFVCSVSQAGLESSCLRLPGRQVFRQIPPNLAFFLLLYFSCQGHRKEKPVLIPMADYLLPPQFTSFILLPQAHPTLVFLSNFIQPLNFFLYFNYSGLQNVATSLLSRPETLSLNCVVLFHDRHICIICSLTFLRFSSKAIVLTRPPSLNPHT